MVGSKGILSLTSHNQFYKLPSNKQFYDTRQFKDNILFIDNDGGQSKLFNPANTKWTDVNIKTKRHYFAAVEFMDKVWILGGGRWQKLNTIQIHDPLSGTCSSAPTNMMQARQQSRRLQEQLLL